MWQHFGVHAGKHSRVANIAQHPSFGQKQIRVLADVPHIVKNMCGHLISRQMIILHPDDVRKNKLPGCVVSLQPVKRLADFQEHSTFKLAPNLKKEVLEPNHFDKMKVSIAMNVFSHSTAVALRTMVAEHGWPEDVLVTAWFIEQVNRWFDLMCSRHPVMALSLHNPEKHEEAVSFLRNFMDMFSRVKIGNGAFKPCQTGVILSTTSMLQLQEHLLKDLSFDFVLTSRFTQDSLENFFSTVRQRNAIPTPLEFKMALKIISVSQYLKVSTAGSYDVDDGTLFLADFDTSSIAKDVEPDPDLENLSYGTQHLTQAEESAFYYYCGYIVSRILQNNVTCDKCRNAVTDESTAPTRPSGFTKLKCYKTDALVCVPDKLFKMLLTCESCFTKNIERCEDKENIVPSLHAIMCAAVKHIDIESSHDIKDKIIRRFCHARHQLHLSDLSRKTVKKAKDMGSKSMCAPRRQK